LTLFIEKQIGMPYDFNYPEERTNPNYKFDEIIADYNYNFSLISTGSTEFTGNTSASCISDLYVENLHGCSALTIHGQIKQVNNVVAGENSIAFGENNSSGYYQEGTTIDIISACTIYTDYGPGAYYLILSGDQTTEWNNYLSIVSPINVLLYGGTGATLNYSFANTYYDLGLDITLLYTDPLVVDDSTFTSFSASIETQATIDNRNTYAGGINTVAYGDNSFVHSVNSAANGDRSVVLGGQNITGANDDTVYVPNLNINTQPSTNNGLSNILVWDSDGSVRLRDSSSLGGSISYNNVVFVDPQFGNNATGLVERLDKPYQSISTALSAASTLSPSSTNRILVYLRAGYYSASIVLVNNVDIYCEPGVVIYGVVQDTSAVVSNFLGYASFLNYPLNSLSLTYSSTVNFEFDTIQSSGRAMYIGGTGGNTPTVRIKGNYIYCTTNGTGHGITLRNNSNVYMDISRGIEAIHSTIEFRTHGGDFVLNCPKIYLGTGNIYGGNYKQAFIFYSTTSTSNIIINGDVVNKDTIYYGGISGMITFWGSCPGSVIVNGNVYGRGTIGVYGNNTTNGKFTMNGSVFSDIEPGALVGSGEYYFKNGTHGMPSSATTVSRLHYIGSSAKVYFSNVMMYNDVVDGNTLHVDSTTCSVSIFNSLSTTAGSAGEIISATTSGATIMIHNTRSNKPLSAILIDTLSPTGLIVDSNLIIPKF
jgi:hypothetical protein